MDELLPDMGTPDPIELSELVDVAPTQTNLPMSSVRNRAATSAMISGQPDKVIDNYRLIMQEGSEGKDTTHQEIMNRVALVNRSQSIGSVVKIMGDPTISMEQKRKVMNVVQTSDFKPEPTQVIASKMLEAPSKGEDIRGEAARISLSESMDIINKDIQERQKLMNGFMAALPEQTAGQVTKDVAASEVMPFGRNIVQGKISSNLQEKMGVPQSIGQWAKNFLLPGSSEDKIKETLESIPPGQRYEYTKKILQSIKESSAIFSSDAAYTQFSKATELLDSPRQSDVGIWASNFMTLLDAFWVGSEAKSLLGAGKTAKSTAEFMRGRKEPSGSIPATSEEVVTKAGKDSQTQGNLSYRMSTPDQGTPDITKQIKNLEEEKASLLGDAGNLADKGAIAKARKELSNLENNKDIPDLKELTRKYQDDGMKFKDAQAKASSEISGLSGDYEAKVSRLKNFIETNSSSSQVSQKLDAIDKQIAQLKKQEIPGVGKLNPIADAIKRLEINSVVRRENPVSILSTVEQSNPDVARQLIKAIYEGGEETAQALTGVSKEQALANAIAPQVGVESGKVLNKVSAEFSDVLTNTGALRYTPEEFDLAVNNIKHDFRNATGLKINDAMTTIRADGDHLIIDAHYSTEGGSFTSAAEAKAQAEYALRSYPVDSKDIIVMERRGMDYVPVTDMEKKSGDYIVKVNSRIPVEDRSVTSWNPLDVKRNWTDRLASTISEDRGSAARWLLDPGSMLHPTLTGSASVAVDQSVNFENILLRPIRQFRSEVDALPVERRVKLNDYIQEANLKGLKHDPVDLFARGFSHKEVDALQLWRDIWDRNFYLENHDLVRTLRSQGYSVLDSNGNQLFGKAVGKNKNIGQVLDPQTGGLRTLTQQEMDDLYNKGGHYAILRRPVTINGVEVDHMIVRNNPSEYLRAIRDTDKILNYREGYYTVTYKRGSKFIDEVSVDASGKETRKTVAVAGNTKDAEMFKNSQSQVTGKRYEVREDARGLVKDGDGYWDINATSGRIAQRVRGQPLASAQGTNIIGAGTFVEDPMESAVRTAKSLAGRTVTRPMLDTAKARFVEQYGEFIPRNEHGIKEFPRHGTMIKDARSSVSKEVSDARTTYEYIKYLEDGYINSTDVAIQAGMHIMADFAGKIGFSKAEQALNRVSGASITHGLKGTVFQAYIGMSLPIRQWIVQSNQGLRMAAYNPKGIVGTGERIMAYLGEYTELTHTKIGSEFSKFVEDSGMVSGVDRNSLVRGLGLSMADASSPVKRAIGSVLSAPQKVGFDMGEKMNMLMHLAAVHEKYGREGLDLANKTIRDKAFAEARALSGDLNKAGEFAYTQSSASSVLQFLQMPHKMFTLATNRKIDTASKLRIIGWDMIMFGAPIGLVSSIMTATGQNGGDILPDDQDTRDLLVYGAYSSLMNYTLTHLDESGQKSRVDFTSLSPYDLDGWAKMYKAFTEQGAFGAFAASPAGQVLAVDGVNGQKRMGRIPQAMLTMGRFFNVFEELDPNNPTKFTAVLNDVAKITSGWTTIDNARIMLETRKKQDKYGVTLDSTLTDPEIGAAFLGFSSLSTKELYQMSQELAQDKKKHEEKVMSKYRDIMTYVQNSLQSETVDIAHVQAVQSMLMRTFTDPNDLRLVKDQWVKDMMGKDQQLLLNMFRASGMPDSQQYLDKIRMSPLNDQEKAIMLQRYKDVQDVRNSQKGKK